MSVRHLLLVLGVVATTAVGLAACDKPTPFTTVASGSSSTGREASVWCTGSGTISGAEPSSDCRAGDAQDPKLTVKPGARVEVDVAKSVGEDGWSAALTNGTDASVAPISIKRGSSYVRFTVPDDASEGTGYLLEVLAFHPGKGPEQARGSWRFVLTVKS